MDVDDLWDLFIKGVTIAICCTIGLPFVLIAWSCEKVNDWRELRKYRRNNGS